MTRALALFVTILLPLQSHAQSSSGTIAKQKCSPTPSSSNTVMATAVHNLLSLDYVLHAVKRAAQQIGPNTIYCVSGVPLATNIYQYGRYYFEIDLYSGSEASARYHFRFLYQDASVQANDNVGGKAWVGLDSKSAQNILGEFLKKAPFRPATPIEVADWSLEKNADRLFQKPIEMINLKSLTLLPATVEIQGEPQAVQLAVYVEAPGSNPYATIPIPVGAAFYVDSKSNRLFVARGMWMTSDLLDPLDALLKDSYQGVSQGQSAEEVLLKLAQP